ncbi:bis(5'-nucleosyl)-tetraphosphatase (symmetrical) YqeK [Candidatus Cetobacterium colombiensis]|jgi:predicted HD superfamily hydrolase involved in NAD metabolism|uniref:bis(5'-nucleosyl)-tetraphosphatase (symmetrical) n=1 Tax=Candidatus Cetobacterium colombiensis TaxID=3073100 RepID=A0ABU4WAA3_9FUSO|nr:bis(5'-nucleosyl)-tetraphosphatase (symmetrical) YqeK [Candidatus Cetobacterium colombiensis]MDX8336463.1 bis(5'-nucleosyl)-tetraphosphatase (symmetrical) YqeK [Candidatus Cetobacterium colombiensis]
MDINFLKKELSSILSKKRYEHSIRVLETAIELAKIYNIDLEKVAIAAILHDFAKEFKRDELVSISKNFFKEETEDYLDNIEILHSYAGTYIAKNKFNINDSDILNAIKYHTTGRKNMSLIEKIVYIADAIEPKRDYPHVKKIRELAFKNLDKAILVEVNNKIEYLVNENLVIHINSIEMRNWLLKNKLIGGNKL